MNLERIYNYIDKNRDNLCIVMDFDHTVTDFSSSTSIGVFSNWLSNEYKEVKFVVDKKINHLESNGIKDKKLYISLWQNKIDLLIKYIDHSTIFKTVAKNDRFIIRNEMKELLDYANKNNIFVLIVSSGCGNLIIEILKNNKLYTENINVIANFIDIDQKKQINDLVISPINKNIERDIKNYHNILLFGDRIEDSYIASNENCLKVGFAKENNLSTMKKYYDIIL